MVAAAAAAVWLLAGGRGFGPTGGGGPADGRALYGRDCAPCHEMEGGIGPGLSPRVVASYGTEHELLRYLRLTMPYGAAGTLGDDEYRAITRYLQERGRSMDGTGVR